MYRELLIQEIPQPPRSLINSRLTDVVTALDLSRTIFRRIRLNFLWALGYNTLGIPIAAGLFYPFFGWLLSPVIAAGAMALSTPTTHTHTTHSGRGTAMALYFTMPSRVASPWRMSACRIS